MRRTISSFFSNIMNVNAAIKLGQIERANEINREIVDWLLANSPEIKEKVKYEKRIVSKVVFDCSLKFESKSEKISYIWGEYSLK